MMSARTIDALQSWSSVRRWTFFGTSAVVIISVAFNAMFFGDLGQDALHRSLLSATILPTILGAPLFFYMSLRLRGLAVVNRRLGLVARTDSLTSCLNRGAFTAKVSHALTEQRREGNGALLMIDADNFKAINDLFGHDIGDEALTMIADSVRTVLRAGDLVGRIGGEEFAVFLPGVDRQTAAAIAERIRSAVSFLDFTPAGRQCSLSVSIGGAVFNGPVGFSELFRIADQRLYDAKRTGRNRVSIADAEDYPFIELKHSA